jgi:glutamyl-tRNA reductase
MTMVNVGLSHRTTPAEVLEKLAVPSTELGAVLSTGPDGPVCLDALQQLFELNADL